jgi:hypothetical protein
MPTLRRFWRRSSTTSSDATSRRPTTRDPARFERAESRGSNKVYCEGVCLAITMNLARPQKLLQSRVACDIFMYSITVNPEVDTTKKLREYADMHQVGQELVLPHRQPGRYRVVAPQAWIRTSIPKWTMTGLATVEWFRTATNRSRSRERSACLAGPTLCGLTCTINRKSSFSS